MQHIIEMKDAVARLPEWRLKAPADFTLDQGEHIAIVGPNGSGKSLLVDMLTGSHPLAEGSISYDFAPYLSTRVSEMIKYIRFRDTYGSDTDRTYYLQQRWNQGDLDDSIPMVDGKPIIALSSGELRRLTLGKALESRPRVLIIDNPFIGLDEAARKQFVALMRDIASENKCQLILVLAKQGDIPDFITRTVSMGTATPILPSSPDLPDLPDSPDQPDSSDKPQSPAVSAASVIEMRDVTISYGGRKILDRLNWTVSRGEHWALTGPNGSGKSTLLSLITADNPQSYACDIALFGRRRGSGESIWDIKRHIGYCSPEMHRAFRLPIPVEKVVASGLHDSMGQYVRIHEGDIGQVRRMLEMFGLTHLEGRSFLSLSSGEQRLVLLARAFVKDPALLILDEPMHGLDDANSARLKTIIEDYCANKDKTLIMVSHYREDFPPCVDKEKSLAPR